MNSFLRACVMRPYDESLGINQILSRLASLEIVEDRLNLFQMSLTISMILNDLGSRLSLVVVSLNERLKV